MGLRKGVGRSCSSAGFYMGLITGSSGFRKLVNLLFTLGVLPEGTECMHAWIRPKLKP